MYLSLFSQLHKYVRNLELARHFSLKFVNIYISLTAIAQLE